MAELMGNDALKLVGIVRLLQQPGVDIDHLPGRHEGVDLVVADQDDLDVVGPQAGGLDQRLRQVAEQELGLAVAKYLLGRGRLNAGEQQCEPQHEERGKPGRAADHGPYSHSRPEQRMKPSF